MELLAFCLKNGALIELCAPLHRQAPAAHARRPLFVKQLRDDGATTIEVLLGTVSKRYMAFATRPGVPHTTLENIQTAYEAGNKNPGYFLVCAKAAPVLSHHGTYAVETQPVGYSHVPAVEQVNKLACCTLRDCLVLCVIRLLIKILKVLKTG